MPSAQRLTLEHLLRTHKLDGTLTSNRLDRATADGRSAAATGIPALDDWLGGGLPRGQLSEVVGPRSSGRTSFLCAMLAAATGRGELVALIDLQDAFDPESGAAAGIEMSRLLWIRGPLLAHLPTRPLAEEVGRALKALNLVLQAGGFGVVALDLTDVPAAAIRRVPFATWLRIQRVIDGSQTTCVVVGSQLVARSAGGLSIVLQPDHPHGCWVGQSDRARLLNGLDVRVRVVCARRRAEDMKVLRFQGSKVQGC